MNDPYIILNVKPTATDEEIKTAYRRIAMQTHPDKNGGDPAKTQMFREATDAYHFLMDKTQREAYDYYRTTQDTYHSETFYEAKTYENKSKTTQTEKDLHNAFMEAKNNLHEMWVNILIGLGSLALGVIPTLISYAMAEPGGHYRVFSGLIFVGAIGVIKGLFGAFVALGNMATIKAKEKNIFGSGNATNNTNKADYSGYANGTKKTNDRAKKEFKSRTTNTEKEQNNRVRFCYKCGNTLADDAVFCDKCGTRIR